MKSGNKRILRLYMPQWQGGNNPLYHFGASLLSWLAPSSGDPIVTVPIEPYYGKSLETDDGIVGRKALLRQMRAARHLIDAYDPERIVVLGGDCSVDLAPFAWLNRRYGGNLGVLWLDAHPDVSGPGGHRNANTMVVGHLLGKGDAEFAGEVEVPIKPRNLMLAGLQKISLADASFIEELNIRHTGSADLIRNSDVVLRWLREEQIEYLTVHLDLDVLNPEAFRLPPSSKNSCDACRAESGMTLPQLLRLLGDIDLETEIVGIGIAEYLPKEVRRMQGFLEQLPILNQVDRQYNPGGHKSTC